MRALLVTCTVLIGLGPLQSFSREIRASGSVEEAIQDHGNRSIVSGMTEWMKSTWSNWTATSDEDSKVASQEKSRGILVSDKGDVAIDQGSIDELKSVHVIERIPPRREDEVSANDLLTLGVPAILQEEQEEIVRSAPQEVNKDLLARMKSMRIVPVKTVASEDKDLQVPLNVTEKSVAEVTVQYRSLGAKKERLVAPLTKVEKQRLAGLILSGDKDRCLLTLGLMAEVSRSSKKYRQESDFYAGMCALHLGYVSEGMDRLMNVIRSEDPRFTGEAIDQVLAALKPEYEANVERVLRQLKNQNLISAEARDHVEYLQAKTQFKLGRYLASAKLASRVGVKSKYVFDAKYVEAASFYMRQKYKTAVNKMEDLTELMRERKYSDENLSALVNTSLGRSYFRLGEYEKSIEAYRNVSKKHPLWVEALVEQGWAQLQIKDFSGAIGNMYSLHSPYFQMVYLPDSHVVRSIGYLNICQYGDAYRSLSKLEKDYRDWFQAASNYIKAKPLAKQYYQTVADYLRGRSDLGVDGLPPQVVREMARRRNYLVHQQAINGKIDEINSYDVSTRKISSLIKGMKVRLMQAQRRYQQVSEKIKEAKTKKNPVELPTLHAQHRLERDLILGYRYQISLYEQAGRSFVAMNERMQKRIDEERYKLREKAAKALVRNLYDMRDEMAVVLGNNEFLRYEVFAGSGENIRYQVAGGQVGEGRGQRVPASVVPKQALQWQFEGEYWEDEIGAYRSSLKNMCPQHHSNQNPRDNLNEFNEQAQLVKEK